MGEYKGRYKGRKKDYVGKIDDEFFREGKLKYRRSDHRPGRYTTSRSKNSCSWVCRKGRRYSNKITRSVRATAGYNERALRREIKEELIRRNGQICAVCGKYIKKSEITIDHIIPQSKGGKTTLENCQLAHYQCNVDKGAIYDTDLFPTQKYR